MHDDWPWLTQDLLDSKTTKGPGCWEWTGSKTPYGHLAIPRTRRHIGAHRAAWIVNHGPIPPRMEVCHSCDNPCCVRPDHLFLGTRQENALDCAKKGRRTVVSNPRDRNGRKALTRSTVTEIRRLVSGGMTQSAVSRCLGISKSAVNHVVSGRRWSWLYLGDIVEGAKP